MVLTRNYSAEIETSYYDDNGVLTFVIELPVAENFNRYLYAVQITDTSEQVVITAPTPKIALATGVGGMLTLKAAVTGEAGEVIFKASDYITESEMTDTWLPPIYAAIDGRLTKTQADGFYMPIGDRGTKGMVFGGRLSVNTDDATGNTIDVEPFECVGKNGNVIKTSVVHSKIIDQPLVDGASGGGAKAGITSIAANNTFHVYAMLKNDGQVNVGIDTTDATATSLLSVMTDYIDAQLLGSLLYDATGIRGFFQEGNVCTFKNARLGGVIPSVTGAGVQVNCYVPTHVNAEGIFHFHSAWTGVLALRLTEWDSGNQYVADTGDYDMRIAPSSAFCSIHKNIFVGDGEVARIRATAQASAPTATNFNVMGWINHRIVKL